MNKRLLSLMGTIVSTAVVYAGIENGTTSISNDATTASDVNTTEVVNLDSIYSLQEVMVKSTFANDRRSPLSITTVTPADIRMHTSAPNYLEVLQGIPGVYATASTGSYGDATLNMRGFKQDNISIMLNGIPIQGLTSGSMYWSNWMGLTDATYAIQVQKGIGGSMLADCAMGGMVNIVTKASTYEPRTTVGMSMTQWGTTKGNIAYSTGILPHGWTVDMNLSYTKGRGYVEKTDIETLSYMLSISKALSEKWGTLVFTALGSPEKHDQRNTELKETEVEKYGRDYSKNWGYLNGRPTSIGHNHYFKPYFTLQHIIDGERFSMKNSVYLALANGGGTSTYNNYKSGYKDIISHQTADGHIDFAKIVSENSADGVSKNVLIDFLSGHTQAGAIVSGDYKLSDAFKLKSGLQYQFYKTWQKMEVLDLLGGEYFVDPQTGNKLTVGDYAGSGVRYGRTTHHYSGFLQTEYTSDNVTANIGATLFHGNYQRSNDETGEKSGWAHGWGYSVKGGIVYQLNTKPSAIGSSDALFLNAAYNSRLPYAGVFLVNSNLNISDVHNEKNILGEMGYRKYWKGGQLEFSGYIASWKNKTLTVKQTKQANAAAEKFHITGLNALHMGLELTASQQICSWLRMSAYAMTASWKWKSSGNAITYDTFSGATLQEKQINCDGLHVGDAPQTQMGMKADIKLKRGFYAHAGWQFNTRMYADFEPSSRTSDDDADAYQLPSYHLVDATIGWEGVLFRQETRNERREVRDERREAREVRLNVFATCTNIFDAQYIERGTDGSTHDISSFTGYWGQARTVSLGMRVSF